ncbi:multicopper oxidase family protein [Liquorilactobacillus oeni]|uniref:Multicopper oxidase n=1 Tax=Liquorilactobacillus oeni DSM 19972 TaxID=1423777 RepID=A0A0R1M8H2_9LACO|nr:multicopper oxidase domain-containing protein [Liquorilactobacillus oeni]KRL04519.1 multicopper oxidase [Liquorilactobacillus oeni DSM 19972]
MARKVYTDYFFDEPAYNVHDGGYVPLKKAAAAPSQLRIPPLLKPDKETRSDTYYTVTAQAGETQFLPGEKTKTWGFGLPFLGKTIIFEKGKSVHINLQNKLSELTTFHWHGLNVSGPIVDGGCHAPVYPAETNKIAFKVDQPAATLWLHAHPCPSTAEQVWKGLAAMVIVKDKAESKLPFPRKYGVDDIPLILQDRKFHAHNQLDYNADYDPDGVQGPTAVINGTVNPYFDVTTQRVRFRILNGANRREWRLHFSDDLQFTQIGSDGGILPEPVAFTHLMLTCAERAEIIVDFGKYHPGDEVTLYTDDVPLVTFKIHEFEPAEVKLPEHLAEIPNPEVTPDTPIHRVVMSGMDEEVMLDGKKFDMQRIDAKQKIGSVELWDIVNTNQKEGGMVHPYHMHGIQFLVVSRNGHAPYPNEHGFKDTVGVNPRETVRLKVWYDKPGVFMYHCHIIEHEDGGMMAQIEAYDPKHPQTYKLMDMETLMNAFAKERGVKVEELQLGGMSSYKKMGMKM